MIFGIRLLSLTPCLWPTQALLDNGVISAVVSLTGTQLDHDADDRYLKIRESFPDLDREIKTIEESGKKAVLSRTVVMDCQIDEKTLKFKCWHIKRLKIELTSSTYNP